MPITIVERRVWDLSTSGRRVRKQTHQIYQAIRNLLLMAKHSATCEKAIGFLKKNELENLKGKAGETAVPID